MSVFETLGLTRGAACNIKLWSASSCTQQAHAATSRPDGCSQALQARGLRECHMHVGHL